MLNIGAHLSISKGYERAVKEALKINSNTFQFFTRNPRGAKVKALNLEDIRKANELCRENKFASLMAHAPYTYNFASPNEDTWSLGRRLLRDDLDRLQHLESCEYIVMHPGSHVGSGVEEGINRIISGLNSVLKGDENTMVLLEGMSGKGSEVGSKFEELAQIIDGLNNPHGVGVCLDTCHLYSAGYDIVNDMEEVLKAFDKTVGLKNLKAIHLNDSAETFGSNKDRHAKIGEGNIGLKGIVDIINNPLLKDLPFLLETPNEIEGYKREINLLKSNYKG